MTSARTASLALLALIAPATADAAERWRLFVADHAEPIVRAIDMADDSTAGEFTLKGRATLKASKSGQTIFAVQSETGTVAAIASGVAVEDHGEHKDLKISKPHLLESAAQGAKPSHVVEHDGRVAIFYDGDGKVEVTSEKRFKQGKPAPRFVKTPAPHHGVAAPIGEHLLVSVPHPDDPTNLPVALKIVDRHGAQVGAEHNCPELHGEAASGRMLAFACATGLLIVTPGAAGPDVRKLAYADDLPDGKSTTLRAGTALQYFIGNYGPDAVVTIDPAADKPFQLVRLPTRRVDFVVDPARSERVYVMTEDGQIHRLNALTGLIEKSAELTQAYSMDGHWRDPRPRLAVAGDTVIVTDPLAGQLRVVDADTLTEIRTVKVPGTPFSLVAVGGSGETH